MRIPNRTAHIKPATREAIMDQLALAADEIERLRISCADAWHVAFKAQRVVDDLYAESQRRFWHRFAWWRK